MEVTGKIKTINETATYGASGFRKRELIISTEEQYPQMLSLEFVQDKCDLLNNYEVGQDVKVSVNLRGREWINPEGKAVYFNSIQGWRIEKAEIQPQPQGNTPPPLADNEPDDLPF